AEFAHVVEGGAVVVGDSPGTGVEVKILIETADLFGSRHFYVDGALARRLRAPTGAIVCFQYLNFITHFGELVCGRQPRETGSQYDHAGALPLRQSGRGGLG